MALTFYKYFTEERKKRALRSTFAKYVSPAIVDEIMKDPENVELGGQKRVLTVFFSDLRNFTSISEKLEPQTLTNFLNRYLTPMTEVIFANKGTLDKYIGDAVMAFFGAPISYPDHAACACRAALQSLVKLKEIQTEFAKENLPFVDIGIGINSREMSVGNMGSDIVRNYTVIGDAVNLGSRLEGLNKEYGTKIIISEFTLAEIGDRFVTRELDRVQVKGKQQPIAIHELIAEGEVPTETVHFLTTFKSAYSAYRGRDFVTAMNLFLEAKNLRPEDGPAQLYIERCEQFIATPPPADWNGVYIFTKK
jgi:adenylate cyclase